MIRRPLVFVAGGLACAVLMYERWNANVILFGMLAFIVAAAFFLMKKKTAPVVFFIAFAVGILNAGYVDNVKSFVQGDEFCKLRGTVKQVYEKTTATGDDYLQFELKDEEGKRALVNLYGDELNRGEIIPGFRVEASGILEIPKGKRNPKCFDYNMFLKSKGITGVMNGKSLEINEKKETFGGKLYLLREEIINRMADSIGKKRASFLKGVLFGDKSQLDEDIMEAFQKNGTAHILAVSGLHVGIIYNFILALWKFVHRVFPFIPGERSRSFFVVTSTFFIGYAMLASFSPSVVRAVFMVTMHMFAGLTGRRYDLGSSAFAVATMVMLKNPWALFNISFQMSFLAVITMAALIPYIKRIFGGTMGASVAVQLGLEPFMVYTFNILPIAAIIINIPVIFLAGILVPIGLCCGVCSMLGDTAVFHLLAYVTENLTDLLISVNKGICIKSLTYFNLVSPPLPFVVGWYLVILLFLSESGRLAIMRKGKKYILRAALAIVIVSSAAGVLFDDGFKNANAVFVDVGQGSCLCLREKEGTYLFDGGGKEGYNLGEKVLKPYLLKNGINHIDGAFVTHLHTDHYKGICQLAREDMVDRLYIYEGYKYREKEIIKETGIPNNRITYVHGGMKANLGESCEVEMLLPPAASHRTASVSIDENDENSMSLIMKINFLGNGSETSILVTGDVDESMEKEICNLWNKKGNVILSVAHHGSKTATCEELLDKIKPVMAVIQVGKNTYGHPTPQTLGRLAGRNIPVYRNDLQGAVGLNIEDGKIRNVVTVIQDN